MLKYLMFYEDRGIEISYAEGQYVWDSNGKKYLDMHTGHGVAFLGHRHPHIVKSIVEQLNRVSILSTAFRHRVRDEMLDVLSKIVPNKFEYVYLLNSGSEAVDFSLKVARKVTGKKKIIYFTNSFHGRTFGALSVTANSKYRKGFEPLLPETYQLRYNDLSEVDKNIDDNTAAVIVELIQGEGGVNIATKEFVSILREKSVEKGAILVVDEIQTGFGRTGTIWLFEQYGIVPDILLAGKSMGGGFPVSAAFMSSDIASKLEAGCHGSTYGGNPIACAAIKASTEVLIGENVPQQAWIKGSKLISRLREDLEKYRIVKEVRGAGLMIGIDLRVEPTKIIKCLQDEGLLALKAGLTVLRLLPPYNISDEDIEFTVDRIGGCISKQFSN
ncbi:MAG: aspartate aminotransferase family protein [Ignisphaera sp.]